MEIGNDTARTASIVNRLEKQERTQSTLALKRPAAAPPPPRIFRNSAVEQDAFVFSWYPVDDPKVAGYSIYRALDKANPAIAERVAFVSQVPGARGILSYKDPDRNAQYKQYWVAAVNKAGVESPRIAASLINTEEVPSAPQNVAIVADDVDPAIDGKELVITWKRPAYNYGTLFAYAVQVYTSSIFPSHAVLYSGTGTVAVNGTTLTDTTKSFPDSIVGRVLWMHASYPMTEANLKSTGVITAVDGNRLTFDSPARIGGEINYQVIVPDWEQVTRSLTVPTKLLDPAIQDDINFKCVVRGLPLATYYARVKGANAYGLGSWSSVVGPAVLDGIKNEDIKPGEIDRSLFQTGLEPIQIVSSLPGTGTQGQIVFLSTDNKLYRYTGSEWTRAVDGGDLTANTVVTDALTAGCVTSAKMSVTQLDAISAACGTLTSGTLTGLLIRTGASGSRVELDGTNGLRAYDTSDNLRTQIPLSTNSGNLVLTQSDTVPGTIVFGSKAKLTAGSSASLAVQFLPDATSTNWLILGSTSYAWAEAKIHSDSVGIYSPYGTVRCYDTSNAVLIATGTGGWSYTTRMIITGSGTITFYNTVNVTGDVAATGDVYTTGTGKGIGAPSDGFLRLGTTTLTEAQLQTIKTHCGV